MHLQGLPLAAASAIFFLVPTAAADPQWNAGAITGVCGTGSGRSYWDETCWFNGLRGDVIFGRSRNADLGVGPHLELTTAGFDDVRAGLGATLHLPATTYAPIVLSAAGYFRRDDNRWEPGLAGYAFLGSRSFNYHSSYVIAAGLLVGIHHGLGDPRSNAIVVALQMDGLLMALPFLLGYEWLRGPSDSRAHNDSPRTAHVIHKLPDARRPVRDSPRAPPTTDHFH